MCDSRAVRWGIAECCSLKSARLVLSFNPDQMKGSRHQAAQGPGQRGHAGELSYPGLCACSFLAQWPLGDATLPPEETVLIARLFTGTRDGTVGRKAWAPESAAAGARL